MCSHPHSATCHLYPSLSFSSLHPLPTHIVHYFERKKHPPPIDTHWFEGGQVCARVSSDHTLPGFMVSVPVPHTLRFPASGGPFHSRLDTHSPAEGFLGAGRCIRLPPLPTASSSASPPAVSLHLACLLEGTSIWSSVPVSPTTRPRSGRLPIASLFCISCTCLPPSFSAWASLFLTSCVGARAFHAHLAHCLSNSFYPFSRCKSFST